MITDGFFICVCVWGGIRSSSLVIPRYWATALLMTRRGSVGLAPQSDPWASRGAQKRSASKTKATTKSLSTKSLPLKPSSKTFLHAKGKTRLACWNVQSAGSLGTQSLKLHQIITTMSEKSIDLLALSASR